MASDKYDAFPQAIIILLLDLFLVCRWQQPQRCMPRLHSEGGEGEEGGKGAAETRGHRLERYKRVRRSRETRTRRGEPPTAASPLLLRLLLTLPSLRSSLISLPFSAGPRQRGTDATTEILIINSIPFVTRSIYFGAQHSLRRGLGSARF